MVKLRRILETKNDFLLQPCCRLQYISGFQSTSEKLHLFILTSLALHKQKLKNVLTMLNRKVDVIGISETKKEQVIFPDYDVPIKGNQCHPTSLSDKK